MITVGGLIGLLNQSCKSNGNSNRQNDIVIIKKESDRFPKIKDYKQFIGKTGEIEIVTIEVDFKSLITSRQQFRAMGLDSNSIEIPFHCSPVLLSDTLAVITSPRLYFNGLKTLIVLQYKSEGVFNFSKGGDNVDLYLLKDNDQVFIPAALNKDKVLYEIKNNPFCILKKESELNTSGLYTFDYKKAQIMESHRIRFLGKRKFKIYDLKGCD
jgi:hypothetical protein